MRESAACVSLTLGEISKQIKEGVTPLALDKVAYECIKDNGAEPGFLGLYGFPNTLCISRNEEIVHGIPTDKPFEEGEIVSIDCGVLKNGFYGDQAYTFPIGNVGLTDRTLMRATLSALNKGIEAMDRAGSRIGDIGYAIEQYIRPYGYGVVRQLVGHGIGQRMHEAPDVPNYGRRGHGPLLREGLVIAIEPMITLGSSHIRTQKDGWTIVSADKSRAAHYEHTVAMIGGKAEILTTFEHIHPSVAIERLHEEAI